MKLFPKIGRSRTLIILLALLVGLLAYSRIDRLPRHLLSDKQEGDILFQSLPHGDLVEAIEGVSRSEWSHCGILVRKDGKWMVAEAIVDVHYTPLSVWIIRGRGNKIHSYRVKGLSEKVPDFAHKLHQGISEHLGKPYDLSYAPDDDLIYCSELVYKVYDRHLGIKIGQWDKLGDLNWKPHQDFILTIEGSVPLERPMITPVGLTRSEKLERVFY